MKRNMVQQPSLPKIQFQRHSIINTSCEIIVLCLPPDAQILDSWVLSINWPKERRMYLSQKGGERVNVLSSGKLKGRIFLWNVHLKVLLQSKHRPPLAGEEVIDCKALLLETVSLGMKGEINFRDRVSSRFWDEDMCSCSIRNDVWQKGTLSIKQFNMCNATYLRLNIFLVINVKSVGAIMNRCVLSRL